MCIKEWNSYNLHVIMMKSRLLFLLLGLFPFIALTSCSDDDDDNNSVVVSDDNPFVGKWQLMSVFDENGKTDCSNDSIFKTFLSDGRIGSLQNATYRYVRPILFIYFPAYDGQDTYLYSFEGKKKLMLKLLDINEGSREAVAPDPKYEKLGKTDVYKRVE